MENLLHILSQDYSGGHNMPDGDDQLLLSGLPQHCAALCELLPLPPAAKEASKETGKAATVQLQGKGAKESKRHRSPSGSTETASGGSSEAVSADQPEAPATGKKAGGGRRRRLCVKDRSTGWWEDTVNSPGYTDADFLRDFRMFRRTFKFLCQELAGTVGKMDTAIPVEKRVAVCLWHLATAQPFRAVSNKFNLPLSTCNRFFHKGCAAITTVHFRQELTNAAVMATNAARFQDVSGIPDIVGAVYTTDVAISAPEPNMHATMQYHNRRATARNNRRPSYSVTLQASVNADGTLAHVCAGHPGAKSDEETPLRSSLNTPESAGEILAQGKRLVGGAGYPLLDWMLVPYSGHNLTRAQRGFNESVAKVRDVAVEGLRRLKARWGCLQKRSALKIDDLPTVLYACCALHNFCERSGDLLDPELAQGLELHDEEDDMIADDPVPSTTAEHLRDSLANDLLLLHGGARGEQQVGLLAGSAKEKK